MASVIASERPRRRAGKGQAIAAISAVIALASAGADARADSSAADKAAAETLFDDARRLVKERKYAEACPKFVESLRLDTGIGTMLYLADCYEKNGQPASAWAQFREAAGAANAVGQFDREKKARERASALEPKLSRLSISVSAAAAEIRGLSVKRDGVVLTRPLWGSAVPVDPGEHVIEASAPGKKTWSTKVTFVPNSVVTSAVEVPLLERGPEQVTPTQPDGEATSTQPAAEGASSAPRVVGFTLVGIGALGIATGAVTGATAIVFNRSSKSHCRPNNASCDETGISERKLARNLANASTATFIVGGLFAAGGLITVLVTRKGQPSAEKSALKASPLVGASAGGLLLEGVW